MGAAELMIKVLFLAFLWVRTPETFDNADRHLQPFLVYQDGTEYHEDYSVGWQEQVDGKTLYFSEHWFCVDKETLDSAQLYGIFHISDGLVKGNWEVHFRLQ